MTIDTAIQELIDHRVIALLDTTTMLDDFVDKRIDDRIAKLLDTTIFNLVDERIDVRQVFNTNAEERLITYLDNKIKQMAFTAAEAADRAVAAHIKIQHDDQQLSSSDTPWIDEEDQLIAKELRRAIMTLANDLKRSHHEIVKRIRDARIII